ncbi:MAG: lytic transglycosylase domain-containing protein [Burkholderiales bacterium]
MNHPRRKRLADVAVAACLGSVAAQATAQEAYRLDPAYRLTLPAEPDVQPAPIPLISAPILAPERPFAREIDAAARAADLDPALVHAVIAVESAYRPAAVSPKGAVGLMQLMPGTASRYGVTRLTQVEDNLRAGTRHLRELQQTFGPRLDLVLAAYNAGEGAVRRYGNEVPPFRETRAYVPAVMERFQSLAQTGPPAPPRRQSTVREYLAGTRLEPLSLLQLD